MASKKNQRGGIRKSDGIHFVNARPSSETERKKAQHLVRAHVGRWISDQSRDKDRATEAASKSLSSSSSSASASASASTSASFSTGISIGASTGGSTPPNNPQSAHAQAATRPPLSNDDRPPTSFIVVSRPSPQPTRFAPAPRRGISPRGLNQRPTRVWQRSPFPPSHASDSSDSSDDAASPTEPIAFIPWHEVTRVEPQISGLFDPFSTYPTQFPPDVVNPCETYLTTVLWPGLIPRSRHVKKAGDAWFPLSLSDPALFTAFIYGSLCHQRVQWLNQATPSSSFGPRQERLLQQCELEAIELINAAMKDPFRRVSDAVILSVICMAHHQAMDDTFRRKLPTPFKAPFQRLQWLNVYGCLPPNMIHIQGLVQLIIMRGGLQSIKTAGLAATISFSDIFTASVLCTKPGFEFWPVDESRCGIELQPLLGFDQSDINRGFGRLGSIGITPQMAEAFQAARMYINIVRACLETSHDPSLLADQRNLTQYTILSLPPASTISHHFIHPLHAITYEACRLASWIFAVGVIFPVPAQSTPLARLAQQLQGVLRDPDASGLWTSPQTRIPLLWILVLGGIAATQMPERPFFASALGQTLRRSGISSWLGVKRVLEIMLWYDMACDESAEGLFYDAIHLANSVTEARS